MNRYQLSNSRLAEPEWFDPKAFVADSEWPQEVCDFVLALALVHNDFRDVLFAQASLGDVAPGDLSAETAERGNFAGFQAHLSRILAGILHELIALIQRSESTLSHPRFANIIKNLPKGGRAAWGSVIAAAEQRPGSDPLAMLLVRARNKVAFHYDTGEIGRGYRSAFMEKSDRVPKLSRGNSVESSRFYFADAAAQMYMIEVTDEETGQQFLDAEFELFGHVGHALREVVLLFINSRAGFRKG